MDSKDSFFISFILLLVSLLTACSKNSLTPAPTRTEPKNTVSPTHVALTATFTLIPTNTRTSQPTETPSPTVTSTPDYFLQDLPLSEIDYLIPLTVRNITNSQATFFFELENPSNGKLIYRDLQTLLQGELAFSDIDTRQMITIEGLTPDREYETLIILGNEVNGFRQPGFAGKDWGSISFRSSSEKWPLRIGVIGDASFGDDATNKLVNLIATQDLDFLIHTGDLVYETDGSDPLNSYLLKFFIPFAPILHQGPIYTVLGNHDYDSVLRWEGMPFYDYAFPPFPQKDFSYPAMRRGNQYYAFAYQDIQFLMLDTHVFAGAGGRVDQDSWIEERLDDPRFRLTIPVFHVAPYSSSIVHPNDGLPVRYSWNWRFEEAEVPLVLSGHFHHYERLVANEITYIVSGGGSSTLYAQGIPLPESKIYARKTHFVLLEIYEEHIDLTTKVLTGETIDREVIPLQ